MNLFGQRDDDAGRFTGRDGAALAPRWFGQSSFATHAVTRARNAVKVDPVLPVGTLGPLGCGFQTGAGTVLDTFAVGPGDTLAVMGAGAVGFGAVMAAVACAATVFVIDRHQPRLETASQLGATGVLADSPDLADRLRELTRGGVRYALDTTGDAGVINAALASLGTLGTLAVADPAPPAASTAAAGSFTSVRGMRCRACSSRAWSRCGAVGFFPSTS